jgi:hypothetical protein
MGAKRWAQVARGAGVTVDDLLRRVEELQRLH